jgi:type VI secretion system protein ImpC
VELGFASLADFTPAAVAGRAAPGDRERLALILGHEEFRRLEAAWLGLRYLLERTAEIEGLRVRVLSIAKRDLVAGAGDDPDGHRSARLFRLVCEET